MMLLSKRYLTGRGREGGEEDVVMLLMDDADNSGDAY